MRQTCVVEVGQQLFFLHKPLIQPVSQGLCLHRNLFYWVHPEGKRERQGVRWNTKKDYWSLTQQKLSALIRRGSCSPNPGGVSRGPREEQSISNWNLLRRSVLAVPSACFGDSLAGRLIRVSEGDRSAERSLDRRHTSHVAPQNSSGKNI